MIFREIKKIDYKTLEYLEKIDRESMGESSADIYTIKSIIEVGKIIIIEIDEKIIGVSQLLRDMENCKKAQIFGIYIIEKYRGRGFGDKLLKYSLSYLKKLGVNKCNLTVDPENISAINLYERNGFKVEKLYENYYGKGVNRLVMEWNYNQKEDL